MEQSFRLPRALLWVLDDEGRPVPEEDSLVWTRWKGANRERCIVGRDEWMAGPTRVLVSTVFLGMDHNYTPYGPAILYETMVFLDPEPPGYERPQWRYATADEATAHHQRVVREARREVRPDRGVPLRTRPGGDPADAGRIPRRHKAGEELRIGEN